jgi:hypothetical protein
MYVSLLLPTLVPLTLHWKTGVVPPFVGVAVKVTDVPAQTGLALAAILTLTGRFGFMAMVTVLLSAGLAAQVAFEVSTTSHRIAIR